MPEVQAMPDPDLSAAPAAAPDERTEAGAGAGAGASGGGGPDWGAWFFAVAGWGAAGVRGRARSAGPSCPPPPAAPATGARPACTRAAVQALLRGEAWRPHAAAAGPRMAACMRCGPSAASWRRLAESPCSGWADVLPPRVAALFLIDDGIHCAGGSVADVADVVRRRRAEMPAAPD